MSPDEQQRLVQASMGQAHEGRVYDRYLGGTTNYAVDQEFADRQMRLNPDLRWAAQQNRGFLTRAVQYMLDQGVRQFVDLGSGLPTVGNVHQVCEAHAPGESSVVYVDHDPVATAHAHLLLDGDGLLGQHVPVTGDLLDYGRLWNTIVEAELIDPARPVGLLMAAVLHFVPAERNPERAVAFYRAKAAAGSYLAISHASVDGMSEELRERLATVLRNYDKNTTTPALSRTSEEIAAFFGDWDMLTPVVWTAEWAAPGDTGHQVADDVDASRSQIRAALAGKRS